MIDKICPKCEGTGLINYEYTCTVCNGEGVVPSNMMSRAQLVEIGFFNNIVEHYKITSNHMYGNFPSNLMKLREYQIKATGSHGNLTEYQRALGRMIRTKDIEFMKKTIELCDQPSEEFTTPEI